MPKILSRPKRRPLRYIRQQPRRAREAIDRHFEHIDKLKASGGLDELGDLSDIISSLQWHEEQRVARRAEREARDARRRNAAARKRTTKKRGAGIARSRKSVVPAPDLAARLTPGAVRLIEVLIRRTAEACSRDLSIALRLVRGGSVVDRSKQR